MVHLLTSYNASVGNNQPKGMSNMLDQQTINIIKSTVPVLQDHGTAITTRFYQNLFEEHPELLNIFNHANQKKGRQQTALANAVYAAAVHIDQLEAILPAVKQIGEKHRSLGVKREHYPIVGAHLLRAIKEILGDAASDEIIEAWGKAYQVIANVFISVEEQMYDEAKNKAGGWEGFRPFVVNKVVRESSVITSYYLVPQDGKPISDYLPGQYISVQFQMKDETYTHIRQYSLSDAPGNGYYRISVKKEAIGEHPGKVSVYLHDHIKEGDMLPVSAPAGDFVLDPQKQSPVVLISGGVGITPMMSMLLTLREKNPSREITFIHAAIDGTYHAFREQVQGLAEAGKIQSYVVYEKPVNEDLKYDKQGYITTEWLKDLELGEDAEYYFCGPIPFMRAVNHSLKELGIEKNRIHYEFFGPAAELEIDLAATK